MSICLMTATAVTPSQTWNHQGKPCEFIK